MATKKTTGMSRQEAGRKGAEARWGTKSTSSSAGSRSVSRSSNSPYSSSRDRNTSRRSDYIDYEPEYRQSTARRTTSSSSSSRQPSSREQEYYGSIGRQRSRANEEYDSPYYSNFGRRTDRRSVESQDPEFHQHVINERSRVGRTGSSRNEPQYKGVGNKIQQRKGEFQGYGFVDEEDELEFIRGQRGRHPQAGRFAEIWAYGVDEDDEEDEDEDEDEGQSIRRGHHGARHAIHPTSRYASHAHYNDEHEDVRYAHTSADRGRQIAGRKSGVASNSRNGVASNSRSSVGSSSRSGASSNSQRSRQEYKNTSSRSSGRR